MINNNKMVQNTYEMLKYLYDEIRTRKFRSIDITSIETTNDLYALVISNWCIAIGKEGLYKEYVVIEDEEMSSPKGQINLQESIARHTIQQGKLICSYDELNEDVYLNHILKSTLMSVIRDSSISTAVRREATKALQPFSAVKLIELQDIHWKNIRYTNNNIRYKHLIELSKNYLFESRAIKQGILNEDQRMYLLFKKAIYRWFIDKYSDTNSISIYSKPFTLADESEFEVKINKVQNLIAVKNESIALLVCIRIVDERVDDRSLPTVQEHMHELAGYCIDYQKENKIKTEAMLVYIDTVHSYIVEPMTNNEDSKVFIGQLRIAMKDTWIYIETRLKMIYDSMIGRNIEFTKNKQ